MTDQRDDNVAQSGGVHAEGAPEGASTSISRRALLCGASVAVPTVLTPSTGVAIAASSFWATGSAVADPVGEYYVCLEDARPGERYYYDNGASAAAISADRYFVKYTDFVSALDAKHWDNPNKVRKAIAGLTKYRGDQLCADGLEYIPLAPGSGSDLARDVSGKPVIRPVSVRPGALLSTSAFNSMDASGKLSTNALNL